MGDPDPVVEILPPESPVKHPSEERPWLWRPGQSGNLKGRPRKGESMAEMAREILEEVHPAEAALAAKEGRPARTNFRAILDGQVRRALTGDIASANFLFTRAYGGTTRKVEVEGRVDHVGSMADPGAGRELFAQRIRQLKERGEEKE